MGGILGFFANPQTAGVVFGIIMVIVGFVAVALGNVSFAFIAFGFACLIFTAADVQVWKVTVPLGGVLIIAGVLWGTISAFIH